MKLRILILTLFLSGISLNIIAQPLSLQWAQRYGQSGWDYVNCIIPTFSGNLMLGGSLKGLLPNEHTHPELSNNYNAFLAECDTNGKTLWQKTFGGKYFDNITSLTRIQQRIMIAGIFQDTIRFDSLQAVTKAYTGAYIALTDEKGKSLWLKNIGGKATISQILLCSNSKGKVFMAGTFADSLQLEGQQKAVYGEKGFFLASLSPEGSESNSFVLKSKGTFTLGGFCNNDSLVCMAGSFSDTLLVNDTMFISSGNEDVFIAMFTVDGKLKQFITAVGTGIDQVRAAAFTTEGEIGITGCFEHAFLLDNQILKSNGGKDIFIAVIKQTGRLKWLRSIGGSGNDYGYTIATNNNNDIFVSGNFVRNIQMPDENGNIINIDANNAFGNAFIAKYNLKGDLKVSFNLPATSEDYCKSIIAGDNGMITAAGNFYQSMQLQGVGGPTKELFSEGERDIFVLRFMDMCKDVFVYAGSDTVVCPDQSIFLASPAHFPFFHWLPNGLPNRDLEVNKAGTYKLLVTDRNGCIASDSLRVKMNMVPFVYAGNDTIIEAGELLKLDHAACTNANRLKWNTQGHGYFSNPSLLLTDYSPSLTDISKGKVQLILSATNQCGTVDNSILLSIKQDDDGITVFPNPTQGQVTLVCTEGIIIRSATISKQAGDVVKSNISVKNAVMQYDLSAFPPGTFLFHLNTGSKTVTKIINKL